MIQIEIPGQIRSKKNSKRLIYIKRKPKFIPSVAYESWESSVRKFIFLTFGDRYKPTGETISVAAMIMYRGPMPDLSGALESIGDAFEGYLWVNDNQIQSWDGSRLVHDKENPRIILTIEKMEVP